MDGEIAETSQIFHANSDICQQILTRYSHSSAAQHRHLCATAAATRSIIQSSSLPLTPISYFAATITSLSSSKSLDSTALAALTSFLSIIIPLINRGEIRQDKAEDAVRVLVGVVEDSGSNLGTSSVRAVVKSLGILVTDFCNLNDWKSVELGFEWLLKYCIDKRPKVRKCAQDCLFAVFKSLGSSAVSKKASKLIYLLVKEHMPLTSEITTAEIINRSTNDAMLNPDHQEALHLLNVMKLAVPYLYVKIRTRTLSQLLKILKSPCSALTRPVFEVVLAIFVNSEPEVIVPIAEDIFESIVPYISLGEKNPVETSVFAATLAKTAISKLRDDNLHKSVTYFPLVTESLIGLLSSEANISSQAANIFRELIDHLIDEKSLLAIKSQEMEDKSVHNEDFIAAKSICTVFDNVLKTWCQIPNQHFLSVLAHLFLKLEDASEMLMEGIILKLADLMNACSSGASEIIHLQDCIGSAVVAMGPEKILALIPISLEEKDFSCSNSWLIPILKKNIVGSSLQFFMEQIIPLAESFEQASLKVKKSVIGRDLQAYYRGCWGLLPAFCRQPSDTYQSFGTLANLLITFLKKDSFMLENIAISLQELINQNKKVLASDEELTEVQSTGIINEFVVDLKARNFYSRKIAKKNLKVLASCSKELLQALVNVLFESPPETHKHLKGALGCLVSICDSSETKQTFMDSLKKFQLLEYMGDHGKVERETNSSGDKEQGGAISVGTDTKRHLILDLASCFVDASDEDLVKLLFCVIKCALQATDEFGQIEAYQTLCRILEKHSWFCSSQFEVVMDLLSGVKSSANIELLKSRFACFQTLLIQAIMRNLDEENSKAFLILNEIILTLKDSNEEGRKVAYDAINALSSKLRKSSEATCDAPYQKFLTMIIGYLSGSSPHIKSGVVSALSVLVYNDPDICLTVPDMFPSVMELLHSKAIEIIKAVLGFVKVFVSCLKPNDVQNFLPDIVDGILRWSSVSRHHFKTKVTVILEIMMRKCGVPSVKSLTPEKYKDYVQGVVMNRRGKTSSKEIESSETKPDNPDSVPTGVAFLQAAQEETRGVNKE
ncbi:ribosomal RNA-processing protein 12 isoform X2 [Henckelia pumila]|uniref:ribosomal RNA-processing protein 12 isoform X2 n=1 Tax=Henckelia pumila TaxID=405737 RepID=UPI003C6E9F20